MKKKINAELLALMMKHHKLIASLRNRKFNATAIAKVILNKEQIGR